YKSLDHFTDYCLMFIGSKLNRRDKDAPKSDALPPLFFAEAAFDRLNSEYNGKGIQLIFKQSLLFIV
ncbi:hypothetical protein, partial [Pseudomonas sp. FSL R10-2172]|uniref:hypothetical protein n=1 Tax=Pseudomonas sp. FSL R10-2172 TaxID=2662198 RepID=UPI001C499BE7